MAKGTTGWLVDGKADIRFGLELALMLSYPLHFRWVERGSATILTSFLSTECLID